MGSSEALSLSFGTVCKVMDSSTSNPFDFRLNDFFWAPYPTPRGRFTQTHAEHLESTSLTLPVVMRAGQVLLDLSTRITSAHRYTCEEV